MSLDRLKRKNMSKYHQIVVAAEILRNLPPMERQILTERFVAARSISDLAMELSLTRTTVRKIEAKALRSLRQEMVGAIRLQKAG